jgi:hypothetical protein
VVERRRCAGTLLQGKCAPHEVEWSRQLWEAAGGGCPASRVASVAQLVGYEAYLRAAWLGLCRLRLGRNPLTVLLPLTVAQTQQIFSCAVAALDLMSVPRPELQCSFGFESDLLTDVRITLEMEGTSRMHRDALGAALDRLKASGVLADPESLKKLSQESERICKQAKAKALADNEAIGLRSCAHCSAREVHVAQFKRCGACRGIVFCSKDCQLANWPAHKAACKAARKAAAGAAAGA